MRCRPLHSSPALLPLPVRAFRTRRRREPFLVSDLFACSEIEHLVINVLLKADEKLCRKQLELYVDGMRDIIGFDRFPWKREDRIPVWDS